MPKRLVVGVDGSPDSSSALRWAAAEALLRHDDLEVVHVRFARPELLAAYPKLAAEENELLAAAVESAEHLAPGVRVTGRLLGPPAGEALVEVSEGADMVVVGTRGLSFWHRVEQGSVSTYCVQHSHCSVVVVRAGETEPSGRAVGPASRAAEPRPT